MMYSGHIAGFQGAHILDLLRAKPFRPFEFTLLDRGGRHYTMDDVEGVRLEGATQQILIIPYERDGRRFEDWVPLSAIAWITIHPAEPPGDVEEGDARP